MSASDVEIMGLMEQIAALQAQVAALRGELAELNTLGEDMDDLMAELDERQAQGPEPEMAVRHRGGERGYPYGAQYPFGIKITGDIVTVYETVVYRGGAAHVIEQQELQITADNDYLAMRCIPGDTPAEDVFSIILWPNDDGVPQDTTTPTEAIHRAIHQFSLATDEGEVKTASWLRALWRSCDLGTMGY